jgi:hypothetical protein
MSTFQTRIEDLIQTPSQGVDTTFITDSLNDAIKDVINLAPKEMLWSVGVESSEKTSNGEEVSNTKILNVLRENGIDGQFVVCKEVPFSYERKLQDVNSMFYPSKTEPMFFVKSNKIYVYPEPGVSPDAYKYNYVGYPTTAYNGTTIGTSHKIHTGVTVTDADPAVFTCGEAITFVNGDIVTLSNFETSTDYNGVTTTVNNVGTDGTNKFRLNGLSSSGAGTAGTVETASSGFPDDWVIAVVYGAALKVCARLISDWVFDEDPEMVQTTTAIYNNIKELYTLQIQTIFPKLQAGG